MNTRNETLGGQERQLLYPGSKFGEQIAANISTIQRNVREGGGNSLIGVVRKMFPSKPDLKNGGWPEKNKEVDNGFATYLWNLYCELEGVKAGNPTSLIKRSENNSISLDCSSTPWAMQLSEKLFSLIQGNAGKFRRLFLEAVLIRLAKLTKCSEEEKREHLYKALSDIGILYEAIPTIEVIDADENTEFEEGKVYRISFETEESSAILESAGKSDTVGYCLGLVNGEPFFELDSGKYRFGQNYESGFNGGIRCGCYIGITLSGKPVFTAGKEVFVGE